MLWLIMSWLCVVVSDFVIVIDCNFLHLCFVGSSAFLFIGCILVFPGVWPDSLACVFMSCCIIALCLCLVVSRCLCLCFVVS